MNPIIHAELGWLAGAHLPQRRDRWLVTIAGVAPDLDGLSILAGPDAFGRYHHLLTHGAVAAGVVTLAALALARQRMRTALLALASFHLHLLCDLAGSGPGWSIFYGWPFSLREWFWEGQWDLASWQNSAIGFVASLACLSGAFFWSRTVVELVSTRWDREVVATVRRRFGRETPSA